MLTKLHLCCGGIYLKDYINVDIWGDDISTVSCNPNITTLDHYYIHPFSTNQEDRIRVRPIVDRRIDILHEWPFDNESMTEIVMICAIEHFTAKEAQHIFSEIKRVLKSGGVFLVDFPDIASLMFDNDYYYSKPEYFMELIYGNHKNAYSVHKWGYTPDSFISALGDGWEVTEKEIVKHEYPMIGMEAIKL